MNDFPLSADAPASASAPETAGQAAGESARPATAPEPAGSAHTFAVMADASIAAAGPLEEGARDRLAGVLVNELDELVYVIDFKSLEILFMNDYGRRLFGIAEPLGKKCYSAIHGRLRTCPWCPHTHLKRDAFHEWEWSNKPTGRHYMAKSKLVEWEGRLAQLEIAIDITDRENRRREMKRAFDQERVIVECVRLLGESADIGEGIDRVLERLGLFYMADRSYLFEETELEGGAVRLRNKREWCGTGIEPQWEEEGELSLRDVEMIFREFERSRSVVLRDVEALRETRPVEYALLVERGVKNLMCAPLVYDGVVTGVIGVENASRNADETGLLDALAFFIANEQQKRTTTNLLREMSFSDGLTDLSNRNSYMRRMNELVHHPPASLGVVFADLNGLKKMNDEKGHHAGDAFIRDVSDIFRRHFRREDIYRVGGDEFVVLCRDIREKHFLAKVEALREDCARTRPGGVALGEVWDHGDYLQVQQMVQTADDLMYAEKQRMHGCREN